MERLLEEAEKISGIHYDISSLTDVFSAIHEIQQDMMISGYSAEELQQKLTDMSLSQTEVTRVAQQMGITYEEALKKMQDGLLTVDDAQILLGTTAKEATTTIEGSLKRLTAAWDNLIVGFARSDSNLDKLISNVVDSAEIAFNNIVPVVQKSISGVADFITKIVPIIAAELPPIIEKITPVLLEAATSLIDAIGKALPTLLQTLLLQLPTVLQSLTSTISGVLPTLLQVLIDQIPIIIDTIVSTVTTLLPQIIELGLKLIIAFVEGITDNLDTIINAAVDMVFVILDTLLDNADMLIEAAVTFITTLAVGLLNALPKLLEKAPYIIEKIVNALTDSEMIALLMEAGVKLFVALIENLPLIIATIIAVIPEIINAFIETLYRNLPLIVEAREKLFESIIQKLPEFLSKMQSKGDEIVMRLAKGMLSLNKTLTNIFSNAWQAVKDSFPDAYQWGKDMVDSFTKGITANVESVKQAATTVANNVSDFLHFSEPEKGPLSDFHTFAPDMMQLFADGIKDNTDVVLGQIDKSFDFGDKIKTVSSVNDIPRVMSSGSNSGNNNITIILELDKQQLAKTVYKLNNAETQRVGLRLAKGVT